MIKKILALMLVSIVMSGFSLTAIAAPASSTVNAADMLMGVGNQIESALVGLVASTQLERIGIDILSILMLGIFVWTLIKAMATGRGLDAVIGDLVPLIVAGFLALLFINGVNGQTNSLAVVISDSVNVLAKAVASKDVDDMKLGTLIREPLVNIFRVLTTVNNSLEPTTFSIGLDNFSIGAIFAIAIGALMKLAATIAIVIFLLIAGGAFIATLVMTQITFTIAIIFMPLFVPFLVFKPMAGMFDQWLKFFLVAGFAKIIGVLMLNITETMMKGMVDVAANLKVDNATSVDAILFSIVQYGSLVLMAALMVVMMGSVKTIASGLIGAIGTGFSGWGELNRGAMSTTVMGGMGTKGGLPAGGGAGAGPTSSPKAHNLSTASQYAPNAMKGAINTLGKASSSMQGSSMAKTDIKSANKQRGNFVGPQQTGKDSGGSLAPRDTSNMSAATKNAYTNHIEGVNKSQAAAGKSNFTIPANRSSTTPPK